MTAKIEDRFRFHNATMETATEYVVVSVDDPAGNASPLVYLDNTETGGRAQIYLRSLLTPSTSDGFSYWERV